MNGAAACLDRGTARCPVIGGRLLSESAGPGSPIDCVLRERRTLVADDQASVLCLLSRVLTRMGIEVKTVDDGHKAMDFLGDADGPLDLVILDVSMPGPNGLEVCRRMRETRPATPVLFLTAYAGHDIEVNLRELQPAALLRKPCPAHGIRRAVGLILCEDLRAEPAFWRTWQDLNLQPSDP